MATNEDPEAQEVCLMCKHTPDEAAEDIGFHRIDGLFWHICDGCVQLLSEWKEQMNVMFLVSDRLSDERFDEVHVAYEDFCEELDMGAQSPRRVNAKGIDGHLPGTGDGP